MARISLSRRFAATLGAAAITTLTVAACSTSASGSSASGGDNSLILGTPGIPTVISGVMPYIAEKQGFYKKYGVNVTIKNFSTGTDATRAVATGQIDMAITPPAQLIELDAPTSKLIALQGQEVPDWSIVSTNPKINSCASLKGQTVGVDAIGGIRYIALLQMLKTCGLSINDVHPLAFPGDSNPQALAAGQLKVSVLHLNEVVAVTAQGKKLTTAVDMATAVPNTMYEMYSATKTNLAKKRGLIVKAIAAQIATIKWMADPKNASAVAQYATVTGGTKADLLTAMAQYRKINFWSTANDGLPQENIDNTIQGQVAAGNVKAADVPKYSNIVDQSVYAAAAKLEAQKGF